MEPQPGPSGEKNSPSRSKDKDFSKEISKGNGFEDWGGYMAAKKSKLVEQFMQQQSLIEKNLQKNGERVVKIFEGLSFYINGFTNPNCDELKRMILAHGGIFDQYYSKTRTSFMIATNLPHAKIKDIKEEKILKPEWIVDCVKEQKLLPYQSYYLYKPASHIGQLTLTQYKANSDSLSSKNTSANSIASTENKSRGEDSTDNRINFGALPSSPSLLNNDTLMNLPASIRNEIVANYESRNSEPPPRTNGEIAVNLHKIKMGKQPKIKRKNPKSPLKGSKKKVTRGPIDFFVKRNETVNDDKSTNPSSSSSATATASASSISYSNQVRRANVCGETSPESVISIIQEWVQTEPELIDEDVAYVLKYFFELIEDQDFKTLSMVAQAYYEAVDNHRCKAWKEAYNNIIMSIDFELKSDPRSPQDLDLHQFVLD